LDPLFRVLEKMIKQNLKNLVQKNKPQFDEWRKSKIAARIEGTSVNSLLPHDKWSLAIEAECGCSDEGIEDKKIYKKWKAVHQLAASRVDSTRYIGSIERGKFLLPKYKRKEKDVPEEGALLERHYFVHPDGDMFIASFLASEDKVDWEDDEEMWDTKIEYLDQNRKLQLVLAVAGGHPVVRTEYLFFNQSDGSTDLLSDFTPYDFDKNQDLPKPSAEEKVKILAKEIHKLPGDFSLINRQFDSENEGEAEEISSKTKENQDEEKDD
jgi:hypothetical protein